MRAKNDALAIKSNEKDSIDTNSAAFLKEYKAGADPFPLLQKYPAATGNPLIKQMVADYNKNTSLGLRGKTGKDSTIVNTLKNAKEFRDAAATAQDPQEKALYTQYAETAEQWAKKQGAFAPQKQPWDTVKTTIPAVAAKPAIVGSQHWYGDTKAVPAIDAQPAQVRTTHVPASAALVPAASPSVVAPILSNGDDGGETPTPNAPISAADALSVPQTIVPRRTLEAAPVADPAAEVVDDTVPTVVPNQQHIDLLVKNPDLAPDFDAKFGNGAAATVLGAKEGEDSQAEE